MQVERRIRDIVHQKPLLIHQYWDLLVMKQNHHPRKKHKYFLNQLALCKMYRS